MTTVLDPKRTPGIAGLYPTLMRPAKVKSMASCWMDIHLPALTLSGEAVAWTHAVVSFFVSASIQVVVGIVQIGLKSKSIVNVKTVRTFDARPHSE